MESPRAAARIFSMGASMNFVVAIVGLRSIFGGTCMVRKDVILCEDWFSVTFRVGYGAWKGEKPRGLDGGEVGAVGWN